MGRNLDADLVVVGAGMAGLTSAAAAALRGLRVIVLEKAKDIGGSAVLSEGYVWTAPTLEALRDDDPDADPALAGALVDGFPEALSWLRTVITEARPISGILGFGEGVHIDIKAYLERCRAIVESHEGWVITNAPAQSVETIDGRAWGVRTADAALASEWILLATGGFQGNRALVEQYLFPRRTLALRANPNSTGDGLRIAVSVGAALYGDMAAFYGHLVPSPLSGPLRPSDFAALAQFHSAYGVLVDGRGERFTDESRGDYANAQAVARTPNATAVLVCDERIRQEHVLTPFIPGMDADLDKSELAARAGGRVSRAETLEQLGHELASWPIDAERAIHTVRTFNATVGSPAIQPPRSRFRRPVETPPFVALEVQPAITFTYGGIRTDVCGRVLNGSGVPVLGLLAAGVDMGGLNQSGYSGGLSRGLVFGLRAALVASGAVPS